MQTATAKTPSGTSQHRLLPISHTTQARRIRYRSCFEPRRSLRSFLTRTAEGGPGECNKCSQRLRSQHALTVAPSIDDFSETKLTIWEYSGPKPGAIRSLSPIGATKDQMFPIQLKGAHPLPSQLDPSYPNAGLELLLKSRKPEHKMKQGPQRT